MASNMVRRSRDPIAEAACSSLSTRMLAAGVHHPRRDGALASQSSSSSSDNHIKAEPSSSMDGVDAYMAFLRDDPVGILARAVHTAKAKVSFIHFIASSAFPLLLFLFF
jgi:hypothetical protein